MKAVRPVLGHYFKIRARSVIKMMDHVIGTSLAHNIDILMINGLTCEQDREARCRR